jgi:hypothetical protein
MKHEVKLRGHYVICDICGKKLRARDAVLIKGRLHTQKNLLVCRNDVTEVNPQQYLPVTPERQIRDPHLIRSEQPDRFQFIDSYSEILSGETTLPSGNAPSAPTTLTVNGDGTHTHIELRWQGPDYPGSGAISGYKIERESPIGGGFSTLVANTETVGTYYLDTTVSVSTQYNYRVSAINRFGTSTASNTAAMTTGS